MTKPTAELIALLRDEETAALDNARYYSWKSSSATDEPTQRANEEACGEYRKFANDFKECADRLAAQEAALTWQPIETAPKGKLIIIASFPKGLISTTDLWPMYDKDGFTMLSSDEYAPTHWMYPAPEPKALQPQPTEEPKNG